MTISIKPGITAWHQETAEGAGFTISGPNGNIWLSEAEATRLAEYIIPAAIITEEEN